MANSRKEIATIEIKQTTLELTKEQVRKFLAPNASDQELFMFMGIARSYNLDPFKREIYFIKYGSERAQIVVGYEVYLKRAELTGKMDGWEYEFDDEKNPTKVTVTIHRKDWGHPFKHTVYAEEFNRRIVKGGNLIPKGGNWDLMPRFMLMKVGVGQAFRLCFPTDMGGLPYTEEEAYSIAQGQGQIPETEAEEVEFEPVEVEVAPDVGPADELNKARSKGGLHRDYMKLAAAYFKDEADRHQWQLETVGKESTKEWSPQEYLAATQLLEEMMPDDEPDVEMEGPKSKSKKKAAKKPDPEPEEEKVSFEEFSSNVASLNDWAPEKFIKFLVSTYGTKKKALSYLKKAIQSPQGQGELTKAYEAWVDKFASEAAEQGDLL